MNTQDILTRKRCAILWLLLLAYTVLVIACTISTITKVLIGITVAILVSLLTVVSLIILFE